MGSSLPLKSLMGYIHLYHSVIESSAWLMATHHEGLQVLQGMMLSAAAL